MTYYEGWLLGNDQDFLNRVGFCAEVEGHGFEWGVANRMKVAASPGFADKYASALAGGVESPGRDQSVINDDEIRAAVAAAHGGGA